VRRDRGVFGIAAALAVAVALSATAPAAVAAAEAPPVHPFVSEQAGRLVYEESPSGDRMIDFSHAGYRGGGVPIPTPPPTILVRPRAGDAGASIQAALDLVAARPLDAGGLRGVVLLAPGTYRTAGQLVIRASGVVLRGSGVGADGTSLVATGSDRRTLIEAAGTGMLAEEGSHRVVDERAPVGSATLTLASAAGFSVGDSLIVRRPSTQAWIERLGMNSFEGWRPENRLHWQPGSRDVLWERRIVALDGKRVTLDAPLTTALELTDRAKVSRYQYPGRISNVGVENMTLVSQVDPRRPRSEDHAWFAIGIDKAEDVWIRNVSARHFVSYVVDIGPAARRVTVQDVSADEPVSEIGGFRRRVFHTAGQQTLFNRCRSRHGAHDLTVGHAAGGPNVFLDCVTEESLDDSGPIESWASGVLFDRVRIRGNALRLVNRGTEGQGAGWTAANSVLWNCEATDVEAANPPGAWNIAAGCKGTLSGDGIVLDPRAVSNRDFFRAERRLPDSLYRAQLAERLGAAALKALEPANIPISAAGAEILTAAQVAAAERRRRDGEKAAAGPLRIRDGAFVIDGKQAWTHRTSFAWFQGQMPPSLAASFGPAITRFAPGRTGTGLTDDLQSVVDAMPPGGVFYHHYGLWYDRRRVNHNYDGSAERRTGEVWGPLLEQPWSRSGEGRAWDGLSKYDLTRFNPWYFDRVSEFARLADRGGRILYYNFYFQHNLLESRSHYVDFPWRPVNAIQATDMPDEVPAANAFYDVAHPVRRDLHRRYIRHSLDVLAGRTNVVYGVDREYSGPLSFLEFWLDTIAEWTREKKRRPFVALEVPKPQMDAILADPKRRHLISAVGFHHWVYRPDGALFSIASGIDRAPRQQLDGIVRASDIATLHAGLPGLPQDPEQLRATREFQAMRDALWKTSEPMRYRAWREYRDRFPDMVLLTRDDLYPGLTHALETAIPAAARQGLAPVDAVLTHRDTAWAVRNPTSGAVLVYSLAGAAPELGPVVLGGSYDVVWVSERGEKRDRMTLDGRALAVPSEFHRLPWAAWLIPVRNR
jgi:hypothetical protein